METLLNLLPTIVFFFALFLSFNTLYEAFRVAIKPNPGTSFIRFYAFIAVLYWSWLFYLLH